MATVKFDGDDRAYLRWCERNPDGFVVNLRRRHDPSYVVLHRATCPSVLRYHQMEQSPGGFTERAYKKLCGEDLNNIIAMLRRDFQRAQPISRRCAMCIPDSND